MNNKKIITFISIIIGLSLILFLLKLIPEKKEINKTGKVLPTGKTIEGWRNLWKTII